MLHRIIIALIALTTFSRAQKNEDKELTERAFLADTTHIEAGKPFHVGFHFKIAEHWHMYWRFGGTVGYPLHVEWQLPKGWEAGELLFPIPRMTPDANGYTIFGYEYEVFFPVKITPPKDLPPGEVRLTAKLLWQVCESICVSGDAEATLTLPVGKSAPANDALFAKWLALIPLESEPPTKDVKFDLVGKKLTVRVGGLPADAKAEFFPIPPQYSGSVEATVDKEDPTKSNPVKASTAPDGARVFEYPMSDEMPWSGLLVLTAADGSRKGWYIGDPPPPVEPMGLANKPATDGADDGETWDPFAELAKPESSGIWALLLNGFLGGLLLNLMPCVLPVISLKIFGFVQQAQESRARIFRLGLAYCAGVFIFFLALAVLVLGLSKAGIPLGWGAQFSNPIALTVMVGIMFVFSLSLLGVFEITLGSASSAISAASSREGMGGAFVHGFFTTLLGTSCTAPFIGPVIGVAVNQPGPIIFALFGSIAFGMALPYFLLTWQPAWMRFIPKPGMWMVRFKQFLGFVMAAFTVWLLGSFPSTAIVVTVAYFLLVLAVAAWLLGTYHEKKWRWPVVLALIAGGWLLFIRGTVVARDAKPSGLLSAVRTGLSEGRPVFVDFTAEWCANCKVFEKTVIFTDEVQAAFKEKNVKFVKADFTAFAPDIATALKQIGRAGVPAYVLFRKRGDAWVADSPYGLLDELKKL